MWRQVLRYKDGQKYDAHWDQFDNPEIHKVPPSRGHACRHAVGGGQGEAVGFDASHDQSTQRPYLRGACSPSVPAWVAVEVGAARGSDDETAGAAVVDASRHGGVRPHARWPLDCC